MEKVSWAHRAPVRAAAAARRELNCAAANTDGAPIAGVKTTASARRTPREHIHLRLRHIVRLITLPTLDETP